jgi:hypothetical protein
MIMGFVSKGVGILVFPALALPVVFAAFIETAMLPAPPNENRLWLPGSGLLISSILLWWVNQYFKRRTNTMFQKIPTEEYAKFSRNLIKEPSHSQSNMKRSSERKNDTGWFMFIPTGFWPYPIAALGLFLIVGSLVS